MLCRLYLLHISLYFLEYNELYILFHLNILAHLHGPRVIRGLP